MRLTPDLRAIRAACRYHEVTAADLTPYIGRSRTTVASYLCGARRCNVDDLAGALRKVLADRGVTSDIVPGPGGSALTTDGG